MKNRDYGLCKCRPAWLYAFNTVETYSFVTLNLVCEIVWMRKKLDEKGTFFKTALFGSCFGGGFLCAKSFEEIYFLMNIRYFSIKLIHTGAHF